MPKKRFRKKECTFCYKGITDTETYQEHNQNVCDRAKKKWRMMQYQNNSNFQGQQQDGWNAPVWGSSYANGPYNSMGRMPRNMRLKTHQSEPTEVKDDKQGKIEIRVK